MPIRSFLARLAACQRGTSAVEYGIILGLIVLAMFTAVQGFSNQVQSTWNNVSSKVQSSSQQAAA
jgi:pilus assembly protein Flp/PilA